MVPVRQAPMAGGREGWMVACTLKDACGQAQRNMTLQGALQRCMALQCTA